ncbi:MAG: ArsR family transcriptional regulator [Deltaproteobacteria bacterium]|nr:ArsR family transcriptional regulator [Deltaproteobacteria bacterium]
MSLPARGKAPPRKRPKEPDAPSHGLSDAEIAVSDGVGRLMEFWGFKRNMGRVWAVMYLSPAPLTAAELKDQLQISSGAVSMTLAELMRWGVVKKVWVQGERKDFFVAETALWRMISRVLGERERAEIGSAVESFEQALAALEARRKSVTSEPASRAREDEQRSRIDLQVRRVRALLELAKLGRSLLDALLDTAKVDAEPLTRFLLGGARSDPT